MVTVFFTTF